MYAVLEPRLYEASEAPRDNHWLSFELDRIWTTFFRDIPRANPVEISFDRLWKARLGLISLSQDTGATYIGINGVMRYRLVPEVVATATVAHELVHYAHGFGSPLPRKHRHPHLGGVVLKELVARGLGAEQRAHQQWIREHWYDLWTSRNRLRAVR